MALKDAGVAVGAIRKQIAEELTDEQAERLLLLVSAAARENKIWSARGLKENMADVLDGVVEGRPQIICRANDRETMVLVSWKLLVEAFKPVKPLTLLESIRQSFPGNLVALPVVETAPMDKRALPKIPLTQRIASSASA